MTLERATSSWSIDFTGITHDFTILSVDLTLDDRSNIYGQGTIELAPVPAAILEDLDPNTFTLRATLTAVRDVIDPAASSQTRTFDLFVTGREKNPDETVTVTVTTDEAILALRGRMLPYSKDYAVGGGANPQNARDVIDDVLTDFLATTLVAGALNADVSRTLLMHNLIVNPSIEAAGTTGWGVSSNASGLARVNKASVFQGSWCLRFTATAGGDAYIASAAMTLDPTKPVVGGFWHDSSVARQTEARIYYFSDAAGTVLVSSIGGGTYLSIPGSFTYHSILDYSPPAAAVSARLYVHTVANAAGNLHYIDGANFMQPPPEALYEVTPGAFTLLGWINQLGLFDGTYQDPGYATWYSVAWDGTVNSSTSTATPLDDRAFDLLLMQPGQTVAKFLDPIVDVTGGRLFCDESRDWRLVDETYAVAGTITVEAGENLTEWRDIISLEESEDGIPLTYTGVVVEYRWIDRTTGTTQRKYDTAGTDAGRIYYRVTESFYPGAGAAAKLLTAAAGRARIIPVDALSNLDAKPGMAFEFKSPDGDDYEGTISKVRFIWNDSDDHLEITPRDLVPA